MRAPLSLETRSSSLGMVHSADSVYRNVEIAYDMHHPFNRRMPPSASTVYIIVFRFTGRHLSCRWLHPQISSTIL